MRDLPMTPAEYVDAQEFRANTLGNKHESIGCVECGNKITPTNAGRWSALWCDDCDKNRVERIGNSMQEICDSMRNAVTPPPSQPTRGESEEVQR